MTIATCSDLDLLHPRLRDVWESGRLRLEWDAALHRSIAHDDSARLGVILFETHRPAAEQRRRYESRNANGERVTRCDGIHTWSRHQDDPSTAMDIVMTLDGRLTWDDGDHLVMAGYHALRDAAEVMALESGGRWRMRDWPHIQMRGSDRTAEVQRILTALGYDCGEVDGIHGLRTDAALLALMRDRPPDSPLPIHRPGRIHPAEWTVLWRIIRGGTE